MSLQTRQGYGDGLFRRNSTSYAGYKGADPSASLYSYALRRSKP